MRPKLKNTSDRATCVGGSNPPCHLRRGSRIPRVSQLISIKLSDNKGLRLIYFCKSVCNHFCNQYDDLIKNMKSLYYTNALRTCNKVGLFFYYGGC